MTPESRTKESSSKLYFKISLTKSTKFSHEVGPTLWECFLLKRSSVVELTKIRLKFHFKDENKIKTFSNNFLKGASSHGE